jgi:hypothetical protein
VDRLELGVNERRLHDGRQPVVVDRVAQITQQIRHCLRRGRDELGAARIVAVPADPILAGPDPACDAVRMELPPHEPPVDGENFSEPEALDRKRIIVRSGHWSLEHGEGDDNAIDVLRRDGVQPGYRCLNYFAGYEDEQHVPQCGDVRTRHRPPSARVGNVPPKVFGPIGRYCRERSLAQERRRRSRPASSRLIATQREVNSS